MVDENPSLVTDEESILRTIKKSMDVDPDYRVFDPEIIMFINSSMMSLNQLGIGPLEGVLLQDDSLTWTEVFPDIKLMSALQTYIYAFVRLLFDPPATSFGQESLRKIQEEQLWRLNVQTETERDIHD